MNQIILGPGFMPAGADSGASLSVDRFDGQKPDERMFVADPVLSAQLPLERQIHRAGQLATHADIPLMERANQTAVIDVLRQRVAAVEAGATALQAAAAVPFPEHLTDLIPAARAAAQAAQAA